jgi:uncharacterized protein (DUF302 family)
LGVSNITLLKTTIVAATTTVLPTSQAGAEMITKTSAPGVDVTIDRLEAAVNGAGATVFARVDHAKGACHALVPPQVLV